MEAISQGKRREMSASLGSRSGVSQEKGSEGRRLTEEGKQWVPPGAC